MFSGCLGFVYMKSNIFLYQICYQNDHIESLDPDFMVLENRENLRPDWREYWPIRNYLLKSDLDEECYYGFMSPKFSQKTGLRGADVKSFISAHSGADIFTFSPQADMGALFLNVFEQGDTFDPGFFATVQELLIYFGYSVDLKSLVMDSRQVVFSNFIVARPAFWREWLNLCEKIFDLAESGDSDLADRVNRPTSYPGSVPCKVFIIERMASFLLASGQWCCAPYSTYQCAWSALPTSQFKQEAISSDALKMAYNETKNEDFLSAFAALRNRLFFSKKQVTQPVSRELVQVVKDYLPQIPLDFCEQEPQGDSAAPKSLIFHILDDNSEDIEVLDIGFGAGKLGSLVKNTPSTSHWLIDGVDGFKVNCHNSALIEQSIYRNVWHGLAQDIPAEQFGRYKIVCLLDVIEHLHAEDAKSLLHHLLDNMRHDAFLFISTPLWFYPQDSMQSGDLEEHLIGVPATSMMALLPKMYSIANPLVGGFVLGKRSLDFIDLFQPTTDRTFSYEKGVAIAQAVGCEIQPGYLKKMW